MSRESYSEMGRRRFLADAFKIGGLAVLASMGGGCVVDAAMQESRDVLNRLGGRQTESEREAAEERARRNSLGPGQVEYTHPTFGNVYACMALGITGTPDIQKGRGQFIGINNMVDRGSGNLWFYTEASGSFGNPKFAVYEISSGSQISNTVEHNGWGDKFICQFPKSALTNPGQYVGVLQGQRVQPGLIQTWAKGVGPHLKVSEINFRVN